MSQPRILLIEDNADTRKFLEIMIGKHYEVISAENGILGVELARNKNPDLILLDIMLPMLNGYDVCKLLKKDERTESIPVIFLSAKGSIADVTSGLEHGADDYISKPFDHKELLARIHARLRSKAEVPSNLIQIGDLKLDVTGREVYYSNRRYQLTSTEFDLLFFFLKNVGKVIKREIILKEVWKEDAKLANERTIDVHIRAIRKKIPPLSKHIVAIYGAGYKYSE